MKKDQKIGIITSLFGVIALIYTYITIPVTLQSELDPGSRLFPTIACVSMILCGIGIFLSTDKAKEDLKPRYDRVAWTRFGRLAILAVIYMIAMKYIGFLITTPIFLYILVHWFSYEEKVPVWKNALFSILMSTVTYYIFVDLLQVYLPSGVLF